LSGRNKPSLEFVLKVIHTFPEVNLYWLLNGKGSFPTPSGATKGEMSYTTQAVSGKKKTKSEKAIEKIIVIYKDGSFEAYNPSGS